MVNMAGLGINAFMLSTEDFWVEKDLDVTSVKAIFSKKPLYLVTFTKSKVSILRSQDLHVFEPESPEDRLP